MPAVNPFDPTSAVAQNPAAAATGAPAIPDPATVTAPGGLIDGAMSGTVAPVTTADKVKDATASTYTQTNADATKWKVGANQTVAGQLNNTLDSNSLLLQKAQADAAQTANSRGLLNSSMAAGAGTAALLDKALQIATPDAATYAAKAKFNAETANQTSQFNASAANEANKFNANAATQVDLTNVGAANDATQSDAKNKLNADVFNQDAKNKASIVEYDAAFKATLANADAQNKVALTQLDGQIRQGLAEIEANFKTQMATSQSAASMYGDAIKAVGAIMVDKDLDGGAKQNLINQTMTSLKNAMNLQAGISNIPGLTDLVSNLGDGVNAPAPVANSPITGQPVTVNPTTGGATTTDDQGRTLAVNPTTGVPIISPTTGAQVIVNPTTGVATSTNPATGVAIVVSPITGLAPTPPPATDPPPAEPRQIG